MRKKLLSILLCVTMVGAMVVGCGSKKAASTDSGSSKETTASGPLAGKKVAVVRNLANGDHTQQFLAGCVEEGKKLMLIASSTKGKSCCQISSLYSTSLAGSPPSSASTQQRVEGLSALHLIILFPD